MDLDDELCLCFHVTKRKVVNFIKREKPVRASQLSECFGAGTGCGWCRPFLQRLWEQAQSDSDIHDATEATATDYQDLRAAYLKEKREQG